MKSKITESKENDRLRAECVKLKSQLKKEKMERKRQEMMVGELKQMLNCLVKECLKHGRL